jgi:hypothetical protein
MLTGGAGKRAAMGGSVDEAKLDDGVAEKVEDRLLTAWYKRQLGRWPGMPGRRGGLRGRRRRRAQNGEEGD